VGNPSVNVRALIGKPDDPAATYAVFLGLPVHVGGKRRAFRAETRQRVLEAEAMLSAAQNFARAEARSAFVDAALANLALTISSESAATAEDLLAKVRAQLEQRAATALDLSMAETQAAQARADMAHARRLLVDADNRLRGMLNLTPQEPMTLAPLPSPALLDLSEQDAVALALERRAELTALFHRSERSLKEEARLKAESIAPVMFGLDAEKQGNTNPNSSVGASLAFEIPSLQRNQGPRAVARREHDEASLEHDLKEREITREVVSNLRRLQAALEELRTLETHALPATERTLEMTRVMVEAGAADYFVILSARERAYALRARYVDALRAAWTSRLEMERSVGGLENKGSTAAQTGNGDPS
jgi:outer membrane protein TolC